MSEQSMRRADREITDPGAIADILRRAPVCRVAMCAADGPYMVPMSFGLADGRIYLHSANAGRKLYVLRDDPRVCVEFEVDVEPLLAELPCDIGFRYRSVLAFGRAVFVESVEEKQLGLDAIVRQYAADMDPVPGEALGGVTMLRVDIERMTAKQANC